MVMRIGYHMEGWDHLIVNALLAKLLCMEESGLFPEVVELPNRGWTTVLQVLPMALQRFYRGCCQCAVVGIDNDGNADLVRDGTSEDPKHPRHWNHKEPSADCRYCQLEAKLKLMRSGLTDLPEKPAATWPILLAVPVESIEAWLLTLRAIALGSGGVYFEKEKRSQLKLRFYGRPAATRADVDDIALPLIRSASDGQLEQLRSVCRSFGLFAQQIDSNRPMILGPRDCFTKGDGVATRAA